MKVYTLPIDPRFQPAQEVYRKPSHGPDWNIESDCFAWFQGHSTDNPHVADFHYLPVFWNKYFILHEWGEGGREELQTEILRLVDRNKPTFTVCEYDLIAMGCHYDLCNMLVFTGSRQEDNGAIDIPLLCAPHTGGVADKRWTASFVGNVMRDGLRQEMAESLAGRDDVLIEHADAGEEYFVNTVLQSYISLAPRGHGGQTMRFYESMQLGVVPLLIGEPDTRPFKEWIDWDYCSLYAPTVEDIDIGYDKAYLETMGLRARKIYYRDLRYGQWENLLLKELERRL